MDNRYTLENHLHQLSRRTHERSR